MDTRKLSFSQAFSCETSVARTHTLIGAGRRSGVMDRTQIERAGTVLRGYAIGLSFTLAAILLSHLTRPLIGREGPFLWGMVAILFSAYFAGWGPALLTIFILTFDAGRLLVGASIHPG